MSIKAASTVDAHAFRPDRVSDVVERTWPERTSRRLISLFILFGTSHV